MNPSKPGFYKFDYVDRFGSKSVRIAEYLGPDRSWQEPGEGPRNFSAGGISNLSPIAEQDVEAEVRKLRSKKTQGCKPEKEHRTADDVQSAPSRKSLASPKQPFITISYHCTPSHTPILEVEVVHPTLSAILKRVEDLADAAPDMFKFVYPHLQVNPIRRTTLCTREDVGELIRRLVLVLEMPEKVSSSLRTADQASWGDLGSENNPTAETCPQSEQASASATQDGCVLPEAL